MTHTNTLPDAEHHAETESIKLISYYRYVGVGEGGIGGKVLGGKNRLNADEHLSISTCLKEFH